MTDSDVKVNERFGMGAQASWSDTPRKAVNVDSRPSSPPYAMKVPKLRQAGGQLHAGEREERQTRPSRSRTTKPVVWSPIPDCLLRGEEATGSAESFAPPPRKSSMPCCVVETTNCPPITVR